MKSRNTKMVEVDKDTWEKLWELKLDMRKKGVNIRSFKEIIALALGVFELVYIVCDEYCLDPISATADAMKMYSEYLEMRWKHGQKKYF